MYRELKWFNKIKSENNFASLVDQTKKLFFFRVENYGDLTRTE